VRTRHVINVTPDQGEHPGAVITMTDTVEDDLGKGPLSLSRDLTEYAFSVDGREYTPAQFLRIVRQGANLEALEEHGRRTRPGWTFVVGSQGH
jgi:hypothetical protein